MLEGLFQPLHLFVVLVVVLVIFGPSRLPELGESLGRSIRTFKKGLEEQKSLASPKADDQITEETKG
jgi:sec-independent protein translocase protein TatA